MGIEFRSKNLSPVETSFLKWQYGFEEEDDPFERSLWHTILHAWEADRLAYQKNSPVRHLPRLGSPSAYPEEVALYVAFKSDDSDSFWNDLIRRAGLSDRRQDNVVPMAERRRHAGARA
ncbi:MAG: hypothetical protein ABL878_18970 [Burkholderiales bacterium]